MWTTIISLVIGGLVTLAKLWLDGRRARKLEVQQLEKDNEILKKQRDITVTTIDAAKRLRERIERFYR